MIVGSAWVAAWLAHIAFWVLLVIGWVSKDLGLKGAAVFVVLWLAGLLGLSYVPYGAAVFPSVVAVLDIALVFMVFKGGVRLS